MPGFDRLTYRQKLERGGNCTATTNKDLPCPHHGDRLVDGKWLCHIHDPDGTFQRQHRRAFEDHQRTPEVEGQMTFAELITAQGADGSRCRSDEDAGDALFHPPDDTQGRIASKRIKKWEAPE